MAGLEDGFACKSCGTVYPTAAIGPLDMRLQKSRPYPLALRIGQPAPSLDGKFFTDLPPNPTPDIADWAYDNIDEDYHTGNRITPELVSYFPRATGADQWMLDLGCGHRQLENFCHDKTGFNYIGMDYDGHYPHILGDAHALPFRDNSLDLILSVAVLEHLAFPDIALAEIARVLRPGGRFIGTVAFLETFHMDSHYHMTHLGTARLLDSAGLELMVMAPNREWSGLQAMAKMALYPGLPDFAKKMAVGPAEALSQALVGLKRKFKPGSSVSELDHIATTTGGFRFAAQKPA
jgi:SAM-dependent methyltransferase